MQNAIERLGKWSDNVSRWFSWIAGAALVTMMSLTVADVIGIKSPIKSSVPGGMDIVNLLGIISASFAIAYTKILGGHVNVEVLLTRLPKRLQAWLHMITSLLGMALFIFLGWQSFIFARSLQISGDTSMTYDISKFPFAYAIFVACIPICMVLILDFFKALSRVTK